jgi:signal transduction histidine kinase
MLWVASVLLPLAGLVGAGWWCWVGLATQVTNRMTRTIDMMQEQSLRAFEAQEAVLVAIDWNIRALPWDEIRRSAAVREFLNEIDDITPTVEGIGIVAPDGHLASATAVPDDLIGTDLSDRDFVQAARAGDGQTYIGAPQRSLGSSILRVNLSRPRRTIDGKPDGGVIYVGFRSGHFEEFYRSMAPSPATGFNLFRADGVVLASYPTRVPDGGLRIAADDERLINAQTIASGTHSNAVLRMNTPTLFGYANPVIMRKVTNLPLFVSYTFDMSVVRDDWMRQMVTPAMAAIVAMGLMLLLTAHAQYRLALEQARSTAMEKAAHAAQQHAEYRADAESRLRRTEKIATLGQLSAGVAHDFNNLLQMVSTTADHLKSGAQEGARPAEAAELLHRVTRQGVDLVRRMLHFARRDEQTSGTYAVDACLHNLHPMLARTLGSKYDLRIAVTSKPLSPICGSAAEFEAVMINLLTNARDAMPDGGVILVRVTTDHVPETDPSADLAPGDYVQITVTDNGGGMDDETLARAGEAFFTTKAEGTGLGLAMARGFAERCGGQLRLESSYGHGTKVTLRLPANLPLDPSPQNRQLWRETVAPLQKA